MKDKEVARAYCRALLELGESMEVGVVEELTTLTEAINSSNDLENVLFLEVFSADEKQVVLEEVLGKMKLSPLAQNFLLFLCQEKRLGLFPLVFKELIVVDDEKKGFLKGVVEGVDVKVDSSATKKFTDYLEKRLGKKVQLDYRQNSALTAGYRVSVEDLQLDATVDHQLERFKKEALSESL